MSNSEDEFDDTSQPQMPHYDNQKISDYSVAVSWPILLAIVPTLGAFFVGSADVWSDFILVVLILFYVYKWVTVPWSYYESARSRLALFRRESTKDDVKRREKMANELRRHELFGLVWIIASPAIAGFTLQFSRYFLSNYDRYMSSFNVVVFILAASIKPLTHIMKLLRERTVYLQSEIQVTESQVGHLQQKIDTLNDELLVLRNAFATKEELGQFSEGLNPTIQQLAKAVRRFERKETALRSWSEGRFLMIDEKVQKADQFVRYHIEQDQRNHSRGVVVSLVMLPLNISLWFAQRFAQIPRHLFGISSPPAPLSKRHLMAS